VDGNRQSAEYEAVLIVGFGGPEGRDDVLPFLENVTRGRNVPRDRLLAVAEHYDHFDGVSPINAQVRELIAALGPALRSRGVSLPIFWGNRNWHPLLPDTVREMTAAGVRRALGLVLAAYGSYSSCRQYLENIAAAQSSVGPQAPRIDKIRLFHDHPGFVEANADHLRTALDRFPADRRGQVHVAFTAHSIPMSMAAGCGYAEQLARTSRLVAEACGVPPERWRLVYQSRSGRPEDPWLEPDVLDHLAALHGAGVRDAAILPVGFLSDHLEVLYDLDVEAADLCREKGMHLERAKTVGTHPAFVALLAELIHERLDPTLPKRALSPTGPAPDECPATCCPAPQRPRPAAW
jgi:ferrochelatase